MSQYDPDYPPSGCSTFFIMFGMLVIPLFIYTLRSVQTKTITFPFYIEFTFLASAGIGVVLLSIFIAAIYTISQRYGFLKQHHTKLSFLIIATGCALIVAAFGPVLPTNEQIFFYMHKDEFLSRVEAIKQGASLSQYNNLAISAEENSNVITFSYNSGAYKITYAYVYAERYSDLEDIITCAATSQGTGGTGKIYAILDTKWYLCYRVGD